VKRRDFLKRFGVIGALLSSAPLLGVKTAKAKGPGNGPAYVAVDDMPPGWKYAEVIDLYTGKPLQHKGEEAKVTKCSSIEGWALVRDGLDLTGHWVKDEIVPTHKWRCFRMVKNAFVHTLIEGRFEIRRLSHPG